MIHHLICTSYYANTVIIVSLLIYATICVEAKRYPIFGIYILYLVLGPFLTLTNGSNVTNWIQWNSYEC